MQKMKLILFVLFITSCSGYSPLSKNIIKKNRLIIKGGVYEEKKWSGTLIFERTSWFHELSLYFDLLHYRIDTNSQFYHWFSLEDRKNFKGCKEKYIFVTYSLDTKISMEKKFIKQILEGQFEEIKIDNYIANLSHHPDFERFSLNRYSIKGYCKLKPVQNFLWVFLPGFQRISLAL
jgi:hypothetical protein